MTWESAKLEELASQERYAFVGGPFGSKLTSRDYAPSGVPVIRGGNLNGGRFLDMDDFVFVSEDKVRRDLSSNLAHPNDLIFTQRGTLGQVAIVPEDGISDRYVVSQSQMKLTVDERKADRLFLYYYFSSRTALERITNLVSSSGVPHINLTVLRNFDVPVPPLKFQRRIGEVLSAYDDLIETNRNRIQLLEDSARLLYKEWFVYLRFPGHEHTKVVDGVPEGWRRAVVGDLLTLQRGFDITKSQQQPGPYPVVSSSGVRSFHAVAKVNGPGVVVGRKGTLGTVHYIESDYWPHDTSLWVKDFKGNPPLFVRSLLRQLELERYNVGGANPTLNRNHVHKLACLAPPARLIVAFEEAAASFYTLVRILERQNDAASRARDLLLPRLMSGEVAV